MKARFLMNAESLNRGLTVAAIEGRKNMIPVPRGVDKAQQVFGMELRKLIEEMNEVLVA